MTNPTAESIAPTAESIAELVARLGPPPKLVVEDWRDQLLEMLRHNPHPATRLSPEQLAVDGENRLSWIEPRCQLDLADCTTAPPPPSSVPAPAAPANPRTATTDRAVENFLMQVAEPPQTADRPRIDPPPEMACSPRSSPFLSAARRVASRPAKKLPAARRTTLAVACLAALAALLWAVDPIGDSRADRSSRRRAATEEAALADKPGAEAGDVEHWSAGTEQVASGSASHAFDMDFAAEPAGSPLPASSPPLSSLNPLSTDLPENSPHPPSDSSELDLDRLFPSVPSVPQASVMTPSSEPADASPPMDAAANPVPSDGGLQEFERGPQRAEEQQPLEGQQATDAAVLADDAALRVRKGPSVLLPATDAAEASVVLAEYPVSELSLQWPASKPALTLGPRAEGRWPVLADSSAEQPQGLAVIESTTSGTHFRWTPAAATAPIARQLPNARLRIVSPDGGSRRLYLRPTIEIDPLPLSFKELDRRTAWSLGSPIDATGCCLQIDMDVPDEVQWAWIEAPAAQSPRRMRVVAQLALEKDEFAMLRIRWDLQAGARLSCRQRTAARLDASMPWQMVSLPALSRSTDELIAKLARQQQVLQRLLAIYSDADYQERKALRPRRDALQQQVETLNTAATRLSQLIHLMEQLEAAAVMRFELTTVWPDGTQTILTTGGETKDKP